MKQQRHLAAILFTDIVGYTAMMQENEIKAVAMVKRYLSILKTVITNHSGNIVNDYGDGSLCTFSSAIDAVQAAFDMQEELRKEDQIPLRIGLHIGEIFFEDGKVFGDGVNIASRIQSLGQANTILFSGEINSKIRNRPEFNSVSLGKFEFKNVEEPIEVFALSNTGLIVPKKEEMKGKLKDNLNKFSRRRVISVAVIVLLLIAAMFMYTMNKNSSKFTGKEKSIAVLAFVNMSTDKENEYFSDGMTEEITTQLSKIADLKVIARTSAMLFKGSKKSIKEIAGELGVSTILEGSVQKDGNKIRITAQLIDASTEEHLWADKYDREFKDVFAIQSEVAQEIAFQLNANLTKEEKKKIEKVPTNNPEAYQFYLQGNQLHTTFWTTHKKEHFENSRTFFEKALALDSNYAIAHAALADLYNTYSKSDTQFITLQSEEIKKAWKLDSINDYVNNVMGVIEQSISGNKELAYKYLRKSVEINPNNPLNLWSLGLLIGHDFGLVDEAKLLLNRTVELDPLTANNFGARGACNYYLGKYQDALKDMETALRIEPGYVGALDMSSMIYASMGKFNDAKRILDKSFQINPNMAEHWPNDIGYIYAKLGNKKKALELAPDDWRVLLAAGMKEEALKAIDKNSGAGVVPGYLILKSFLSSSEFDIVRDDPNFLTIMEKRKKEYEEYKRKYSVIDIITRFSSTPLQP